MPLNGKVVNGQSQSGPTQEEQPRCFCSQPHNASYATLHANAETALQNYWEVCGFFSASTKKTFKLHKWLQMKELSIIPGCRICVSGQPNL